MDHLESYQVAGTPPTEPDSLSETRVDVIAEAVRDFLCTNRTQIAAALQLEYPRLVISTREIEDATPDALRWLAEQLDKEAAPKIKLVSADEVLADAKAKLRARLQTDPPREFTAYKLPEIPR